jgi:putative Ca2+/H+ antiporter (TMEM165/GDT1 family)
MMKKIGVKMSVETSLILANILVIVSSIGFLAFALWIRSNDTEADLLTQNHPN